MRQSQVEQDFFKHFDHVEFLNVKREDTKRFMLSKEEMIKRYGWDGVPITRPSYAGMEQTP